MATDRFAPRDFGVAVSLWEVVRIATTLQYIALAKAYAEVKVSEPSTYAESPVERVVRVLVSQESRIFSHMCMLAVAILCR